MRQKPSERIADIIKQEPNVYRWLVQHYSKSDVLNTSLEEILCGVIKYLDEQYKSRPSYEDLEKKIKDLETTVLVLCNQK